MLLDSTEKFLIQCCLDPELTQELLELISNDLAYNLYYGSKSKQKHRSAILVFTPTNINKPGLCLSCGNKVSYPGLQYDCSNCYSPGFGKVIGEKSFGLYLQCWGLDHIQAQM